MIADAACGTGKYWPQLIEAGLTVFGIDHSAGMLAQAKAKWPHVAVDCLALQDLHHAAQLRGRFDALLCVDAMENVGPEDWPVVLDGFRAVLGPGSPFYVTVELPDDNAAREPADGLVTGEVIDDGAYHFYPSEEQVSTWLRTGGAQVFSDRIGDGYRHILARVAPKR